MVSFVSSLVLAFGVELASQGGRRQRDVREKCLTSKAVEIVLLKQAQSRVGACIACVGMYAIQVRVLQRAIMRMGQRLTFARTEERKLINSF